MTATTPASDTPDLAHAPEAEDGGGARWPAAFAGVVAAAVALTLTELLAGLFQAIPSLLYAIGSGVIDLGAGTPVKEIAVSLFGTNDKTALVVGTAIAALVFGGLLGLVARRFGMAAASVGFATFGLIGLLATTVNPLDNTAWAIVPAVVAVASGVLCLRGLLRVAGTPHEGTAAGRRTLLRAGFGLLVGAGVLGVFGRSLRSRAQSAAARDDLVLPSAATPAPVARPAVATLDRIDGISPFFTSNDEFYRIDTALMSPAVDVETWSLRIHGMVDREVSLTYQDLLALEQFEADVTIACVSNEVGGNLIGTARWQGIPLSRLLDMAGVDPEASQIVGRSVDGWTAGFPSDLAYDGRNAMLALGMNGEPLPIDHGFPARLIIPGIYGYVSATKWIAEIELTTWDGFDGFWVPRGWSKEGPIKTQSRIDVPKRTAALQAGPVVVAGVAWAQHRGVERVEVQVDNGEWQLAELAREHSIDTWRQWRYEWQATSGQHILRVRATDRDGVTQSADPAPPAPNGAEGYHNRVVRVQ